MRNEGLSMTTAAPEALKRTHYCGRLSTEQAGTEAVICGWVRRRRDHGGLIFVDLADSSGFVQVVFRPEHAEAFKLAERLRSEYVIAVRGTVYERPEGTKNPEMPTGEVEFEVRNALILSEAETVPFVIQDEVDAKEELRLTYRYLDLRRPCMQKMLRLRHQVYRATRAFLDEQGFCEVETPILSKPTPEGARDFLVPSRISRGEFYALPQSPQLFKQVLMCATLDRYYQIVRCFRDEDLRANRQPEFTQIDLEMSFVEEEDVKEVTEGLINRIWKDCAGIELQTPFLSLNYDEAISRFGVDAPDMRYGLELCDVTECFAGGEFQAFRRAIDEGGAVKGINFEGGSNLSRKELDELTEFVRIYGAKGLAWVKFEDDGVKSPIAKFLTEAQTEALREALACNSGDIALLIADQAPVVHASLGALRAKLARENDLIDSDKLSFLWVERFPLLELDPEEGRYVSVHHPFTSPVYSDEADLERIESDPAGMRARAYDLVLNGQEVGGGSIRIHRADIQRRVFRALQISEVEAREKFGFLLDALSYGAPPHGGIAFGLDRIVMLISGADSIREVIAFPKTQRGQDLMVGAPARSGVEQMLELGIKLVEK